MIGEGIKATIISGVKGMGFIARGISFENTAGPQGEQAVAIMSSSDFSVFYQCGFTGYQDTLYAYSGRQFYKECTISGTVDFIFGYAAAVFQDCQVLVRKGKSRQQNTITPQRGGNHSIAQYARYQQLQTFSR